MTRTEYMIHAALDELPGAVGLADRVTETERRLTRVEPGIYSRIAGNGRTTL